VLTRAHGGRRFPLSFTIVDVEGDDGFGGRVEAAPDFRDAPYELARCRD
jgi:hypothetical protein